MAKRKRSILHKYANNKFTPEVVDAFLEEFRKTGRVTHSAHVAGVDTRTIQRHRKSDPDFDELCQDAYFEYCSIVEKEIYRRAIEGVDKPVFQGGVRVGYIREYSDRLLELEAKRRIPAYRDKVDVDMNVTGGVLIVPGQGMKIDEWEDHFGSADTVEIEEDSNGDGNNKRRLSRGD